MGALLSFCTPEDINDGVELSRDAGYARFLQSRVLGFSVRFHPSVFTLICIIGTII